VRVGGREGRGGVYRWHTRVNSSELQGHVSSEGYGRFRGPPLVLDGPPRRSSQ
jgi:hypothetical protein